MPATDDPTPDGAPSRTGSPLEQVLPACLEEIITKNRHLARCALSVESEVAALAGEVPSAAEVRGEISDWRFVTYEATAPGHGAVVHVHVLGFLGELSWMTSPLVGVDLGRRRVATHSGSIYALLGEPGKGEPSAHHLLHVCATFHLWKRGEILGVLPVFY